MNVTIDRNYLVINYQSYDFSVKIDGQILINSHHFDIKPLDNLTGINISISCYCNRHFLLNICNYRLKFYWFKAFSDFFLAHTIIVHLKNVFFWYLLFDLFLHLCFQSWLFELFSQFPLLFINKFLVIFIHFCKLFVLIL